MLFLTSSQMTHKKLMEICVCTCEPGRGERAHIDGKANGPHADSWPFCLEEHTKILCLLLKPLKSYLSINSFLLNILYSFFVLLLNLKKTPETIRRSS